MDLMRLQDEREHPHGAARAAGQLEGRHEEQCACWRQRAQVRELRDTVLVRAHEVVMGGERGIEPPCGARVDADGFDPHADEGAFLGDPTYALGVEAWRMGVAVCGVQERFGVLGAGVPARVQEQPASFGEWSVVVFEGAYIFAGEQVVRVSGGFDGTVDHDRGGDEVAGRHLRDVVAVAATDPVYRRVEVGARMLAELEPGPRPRRPALVVVADLVPL